MSFLAKPGLLIGAVASQDEWPYVIRVVGKDIEITNSLTSEEVFYFENFQRFESFQIRLPIAEIEEEEAPKVDVNEIMNRAREHFAAGSFNKAWKLLKKAEKADSENAVLKTMQGSLQLQIGNEAAAIKYYRESLKINPNQPSVVKQIKALEADKGGQ